MSSDDYKSVGFFKVLIVCFYDWLLVFSILWFLSFPFIYFTGGEGVIVSLIYQYLLFIVIFSYYSWFWRNHKQTLGMKSWKVYIKNSSGDSNITLTQCFMRILVSCLGGHILLIFSKKSLHDVISKTQLISKSS